VTFTGTQISVANQGLASPNGLAVDGSGDLYIADTGNNRVVKLQKTATGLSAPQAIVTGLQGPMDVAADWSGNVFVSDTGNNRILKLKLNSGVPGPPVTIASSGLSAPTGIAVDSEDNVYVSDSGNNRVVMLPVAADGYGPPATVISGLSNPTGIAVDSKLNLYIADTGNNRVLKEAWSTSGYRTQQVEGKGLLAPTAVAVDKEFDLYIADTGNGRVLEQQWAAAQSRYNTQIAVGSVFAAPGGIAVDGSANVYVAEAADNQVWQVLNSSVHFASVQVGSVAPLQTYNFAVSAGTTVGAVGFYTEGKSGQEFSDAGLSSCVAQSYTTLILCGVNVAFAPQISGLRKGSLVIYDPLGNVLAAAFVSGIGLEPQVGFIPAAEVQVGTGLSSPSGVAVDGSGNLFIADTGNNRVVELPWNGSAYGAQTTIAMSGLNSPMGLAIDAAENLYVVSNGNDKVVRLPWTGAGFGAQSKVGTGMYGPSNVAIDTFGNVYVTDTLDSRLDKLSWTGSGFAAMKLINAYLKFPTGIAVDGTGNLFFTNPYQAGLEELPWNGSAFLPQISLPLHGVLMPTAICIDGNSNLYVLDMVGNQVVMLPWNGSAYGAQVTVATGFNSPGGMAVDGNGNIYVADAGNNQVVKIDFSMPAAVAFANTYVGTVSSDSARTVEVENLGNEGLTLKSINYADDFPEGSTEGTSCSEESAVDVGSNCDLAVNFMPQKVGAPLQETITFADNSQSLETPHHSITVRGIAADRLAQSIDFPPIANVVYGASPIALAATASSGLAVVYEVMSGPAKLETNGRTLIISGAGTVVLQASQEGNATYAAAPSISLSFQVARAVINVTAANVSAVYGKIPTTFAYILSGLVYGESAAEAVTGKASVVCSATAAARVGSYKVTASRGTLSAEHYTFAFGAGVLTISKAVLTVTPHATSMIYGSNLPTFQYALAGYVNGDTASLVSGRPAFATLASRTASVGSYAVTASQGTLASPEYTFKFLPGTLTVSAAVLDVTANSVSVKQGTALPKLNYSVIGFVNGDNVASATSGAAVLSTTATANSATGCYQITVSQGTMILGAKAKLNYRLTLVNGTLTITK